MTQVLGNEVCQQGLVDNRRGAGNPHLRETIDLEPSQAYPGGSRTDGRQVDIAGGAGERGAEQGLLCQHAGIVEHVADRDHGRVDSDLGPQNRCG